ncbi:MAG: hypothetical protein JSV42_00195 [Chloroflexota bacterium]|nr:MAG: hypothetical protein JSV42_00195 [Chloroflexota bacterium]
MDNYLLVFRLLHLCQFTHLDKLHGFQNYIPSFSRLGISSLASCFRVWEVFPSLLSTKNIKRHPVDILCQDTFLGTLPTHRRDIKNPFLSIASMNFIPAMIVKLLSGVKITKARQENSGKIYGIINPFGKLNMGSINIINLGYQETLDEAHCHHR